MSPVLSEDDGFLKRASYFLSSFFGLGFVPKAPGTFGSLAAIPLVIFLRWAGYSRAIILGVLVIFIIGFLVSLIALKYSSSQDPSFIVIDEVAGQSAVFILPSILFPVHNYFPVVYLAGFLLFRLFDIWKPWHVGFVDKNIKGAFGLMLDDLVAALYATIILCIFMFIYYQFIRTGTPVPIGVIQ